MQEEHAVDISAERSNIIWIDVHIVSTLHDQRICSAKLYALRTGRDGGQREQRLTRPSRDPRPKTANLEARKRPIHVYMYMYSYM